MNDERSICESYVQNVLPKTLKLNEMAPPTELGGGYEKPYDPSTVKRGARGAPELRDYMQTYGGIDSDESQDQFVQFIIENIKNGLLKLADRTFPGDYKEFRAKLTDLIKTVLGKLGGKVAGAGYIARLVQDYMIANDIIKDERGGKARGKGGSVKVDASKLQDLGDISVNF